MKKYMGLCLMFLAAVLIGSGWNAAGRAAVRRLVREAERGALPAWLSAAEFQTDVFQDYEKDEALAGEEGVFQSLSFRKESNVLLESKGAVLRGCKTLLEVDTDEPLELVMSIQCRRELGEYKLIQIHGGEVETLAADLESGELRVKLKKGKNVIRLVGRPAVFREIRICLKKEGPDFPDFPSAKNT